MNNANGFSCMETEYIRKHHKHQTVDNQCSSALVKHIKIRLGRLSCKSPYTQGAALLMTAIVCVGMLIYLPLVVAALLKT